MTRILPILLFCFLSITTQAQLSSSNIEFLRTELGKQLNELRAEVGVEPLSFSTKLRKAAEFHCAYMVRNDILSHEQESSGYATPFQRVLAMGGKEFELVGENILYSSRQKTPLTEKSLLLLAEEMFLSWKNSPGHYANMIDPEYTYGDFGFKLHSAKKRVYAAQVFGKKGTVISGQLSSNSFGLTAPSPDCDREFRPFFNLVTNMGNALKIQGDEIKFYYHNINTFRNIFNGPLDGIAADIVLRDQVRCNRANQLDLSLVHDGILLKPIYRDELLKNNEAKSDHRIITKVGKIPSHLLGQELALSLVLIKDGKACKYLMPAFVPRKDYPLHPIKPRVTNPPDVRPLNEGIVESQSMTYDFLADATSPIRLPSIPKQNRRIHSVQITSYSSIEGDSLQNAYLHNARAQSIMKHIQKETGADASLFQIEAKENWEMMTFQLHYFHEEQKAKLSHVTLKNIIARKESSLAWDSLLFAQRRSTATIHYIGDFKNIKDPAEIVASNLKTAVATNDFALANKALYVMYKKKDFDPALLFEPSVVKFSERNPEVVANYSALLSIVYHFNTHQSTAFLFNWLHKKDALDKYAKYNLLHLYTLIGTHLLADWDVEAERLANVVHPQKINKLAKNIPKTKLALNLHLTYIQYYGQINDGSNISKSFNFISKYFKQHARNSKDNIDLLLFFNNWSMYTMTQNHLLVKYYKNELSEEEFFILAQTLNFYNDDIDLEEYEDIHQKTAKANQQRWCDWLDQDFQILRNRTLKRLYCELCNE